MYYFKTYNSVELKKQDGFKIDGRLIQLADDPEEIFKRIVVYRDSIEKTADRVSHYELMAKLRVEIAKSIVKNSNVKCFLPFFMDLIKTALSKKFKQIELNRVFENYLDDAWSTYERRKVGVVLEDGYVAEVEHQILCLMSRQGEKAIHSMGKESTHKHVKENDLVYAIKNRVKSVGANIKEPKKSSEYIDFLKKCDEYKSFEDLKKVLKTIYDQVIKEDIERTPQRKKDGLISNIIHKIKGAANSLKSKFTSVKGKILMYVLYAFSMLMFIAIYGLGIFLSFFQKDLAMFLFVGTLLGGIIGGEVAELSCGCCKKKKKTIY